MPALGAAIAALVSRKLFVAVARKWFSAAVASVAFQAIGAARLNPSYELLSAVYSLLFSSAARSAKALWVDFGPWGLAVEPSAKYCWSV